MDKVAALKPYCVQQGRLNAYKAVCYALSKEERLEGQLDSAFPIIKGWAYDVSQRETPIYARVYIYNSSGTQVATKRILADKRRGDLVILGKGDGKHAFEWDFDWRTLPDGEYRVVGYADNYDATKYIGEKTIKKYTMKYDQNTNDVVGNMPVFMVETKLYDKPYILSDRTPSRFGYTFLGWATTKTATTARYQPGDAYTLNTSRTFYAVWEANKYSVTYDAAGGAGAPEEQKKVHDKELALSTTIPIKEGHNFQHWTDGKDIYKPGDKYTKNVSLKLTAVWEAETYQIFFLGNGGTMPSLELFIEKKHDVDYLIPDTTPVRSGYLFVGWKALVAGRSIEQLYIPRGVYSLNYTTTFIAQWIEDESFIPGDINKDGVVDMADVQLGMKIMVGLPVSDDIPLGWYNRGNIDGEPGITANDVRLILMWIRGEIVR